MYNVLINMFGVNKDGTIVKGWKKYSYIFVNNEKILILK